MKEVAPIIDCAMDVIGKTLLDDGLFTTNKLGTFYLKPHKQSLGYDPYHKTHILKPEGKSLRFEPSAYIRRSIREKYDKGAVEIIYDYGPDAEEIETEEKILVEV